MSRWAWNYNVDENVQSTIDNIIKNNNGDNHKNDNNKRQYNYVN